MIYFRPWMIAFLLGGLAVLGYAPFYFYPVTVLALAGLFYLWFKADTARSMVHTGLAFGLGLFAVGISWIHISLHDFGGLPVALSILATTLFCSFLALFPAAAGYLLSKFPRTCWLWLIPVSWVLFEWVRGWIFTGFPWLLIAYSQIPYSPLSGLAPVFGVYGVSLATAVCSVLIAARLARQLNSKLFAISIIIILSVTSALTFIDWSQPYGKPISFSLLQGNVAQDLKWREDQLQHTLELYEKMILSSQAQLTVLPEMALPQLMKNLPTGYLDRLAEHARQQAGDLLIGVPEALQDQNEFRYFNSMLSLGSAPQQTYRKNHLVPFGEFIPFKSWLGWIYQDLLHIPMADLSSGKPQQPPMELVGQMIAVNICYEDVFGEEIIRPLPAATLLINVSNDAWYGRSLAAYQHLQMSQARALETARMMLRATNTGATALIDRKGYVLSQLPHFTQASLNGVVQGYSGTTPYMYWANTPVVCILLVGVMAAIWRARKKRTEADR